MCLVHQGPLKAVHAYGWSIRAHSKMVSYCSAAPFQVLSRCMPRSWMPCRQQPHTGPQTTDHRQDRQQAAAVSAPPSRGRQPCAQHGRDGLHTQSTHSRLQDSALDSSASCCSACAARSWQVCAAWLLSTQGCVCLRTHLKVLGVLPQCVQGQAGRVDQPTGVAVAKGPACASLLLRVEVDHRVAQPACASTHGPQTASTPTHTRQRCAPADTLTATTSLHPGLTSGYQCCHLSNTTNSPRVYTT